MVLLALGADVGHLHQFRKGIPAGQWSFGLRVAAFITSKALVKASTAVYG